MSEPDVNRAYHGVGAPSDHSGCRYGAGFIGYDPCSKQGVPKRRLILETERLALRELDEGDFAALCRILQDAETMRAYEGPFDDAGVWAWLNLQRARYRDDGFGLWAVELKETGCMIGQCGLTMQDCDGVPVVEVGYLFERAFWHQGYATEAAIACRDYAFDVLDVPEVFSIIRDTNLASQNVALRNDMTAKSSFTKHYRGVDMPHEVFSLKRIERDSLSQAAKSRPL